MDAVRAWISPALVALALVTLAAPQPARSEDPAAADQLVVARAESALYRSAILALEMRLQLMDLRIAELLKRVDVRSVGACIIPWSHPLDLGPSAPVSLEAACVENPLAVGCK